MDLFHALILVVLVLSELFTSFIVVLLPSFVGVFCVYMTQLMHTPGTPPVAEHCESAATFVECYEEFFVEEVYANHTHGFKDRIHTTFMVYSISSGLRVVISIGLGVYLCRGNTLKTLAKVDSVALSACFCFPV